MGKSTDRKGFVFYFDWEKQMDLLNDEECRRFVYNLIRFHTDEEIELNSRVEKAIWNDVSRGLTINNEKYLKRVEANRKNGQLGGRPPKNNNPQNPNGSSENPENLITDNRKQEKDNSEKIIENGKQEKEKENGERIIDNGKKEIDNSELTKEKIEELIDDSKKFWQYFDERIEQLLQIDNSIIEEYNPNNIGVDIINISDIESYFSNIEECWNSKSKFSQKIDSIIQIQIKIYHIVLKHFTHENLELLKSFKYEKVPQSLLTRNNFILYQFYRNINSFIEDIKKIEKEMTQTTL